jgi:hypothetical protein
MKTSYGTRIRHKLASVYAAIRSDDRTGTYDRAVYGGPPEMVKRLAQGMQSYRMYAQYSARSAVDMPWSYGFYQTGKRSRR